MTTAKYPAALLALVDVGGELPGFPEATLSGAHNNSVTTITLTAVVPTAWPTAGWVTVDSEIIQYAGKSGATLTSCTRGAQSSYGGSLAASHSDQAKVGFYLTPQAVNQIVADLIAVQTALRAVPTFELLAPDRWEWYWSPAMTTEQTFTGTGLYTVNTVNDSASLGTGATSASTAGLRKLLSTNVNNGPGVGGLKRWSFTAAFVDIDANTTAYILLTNESVTGAPSLTARHVGIKNVAGVVSFTTGDNTTEQTTVITTFVVAAQDNRFTVTFDGTTARLYIDGTLRATHATNVPGAAVVNPAFRLYITNSAASAKQVIIGRQTVSLAVV